jgi:hypothetical protein
VTTETADRIVIRQYCGHWTVNTKARLLATQNVVNVGDPDTTPVGRAILERVAQVDGLHVTEVRRHSLRVQLYEAALWTWDEVEPGVIAAFNDATGLTHEVVRLPGA